MLPERLEKSSTTIISTGSHSTSLITSSVLIFFGTMRTDVFGSMASGTTGVVAVVATATSVVVTVPRSEILVVCSWLSSVTVFDVFRRCCFCSSSYISWMWLKMTNSGVNESRKFQILEMCFVWNTYFGLVAIIINSLIGAFIFPTTMTISSPLALISSLMSSFVFLSVRTRMTLVVLDRAPNLFDRIRLYPSDNAAPVLVE